MQAVPPFVAGDDPCLRSATSSYVARCAPLRSSSSAPREFHECSPDGSGTRCVRDQSCSAQYRRSGRQGPEKGEWDRADETYERHTREGCAQDPGETRSWIAWNEFGRKPSASIVHDLRLGVKRSAIF